MAGKSAGFQLAPETWAKLRAQTAADKAAGIIRPEAKFRLANDPTGTMYSKSELNKILSNKSSFLSSKILGLPIWMVLLGAGVAGYILYTR